MSNVTLNQYASYDDTQWVQQSIESRQESPDCTTMKYVAYTISLYFNYMISCLNTLIQCLLGVVGIQYKSRWAWWNPIIERNGATLYLGALPLVQKICGKTVCNDADTLEQLGIRAVLSVTEPFENNADGFFLSAVTPQQWESKNIRHLQLSTPDFETISLDKIHQGVAFIHWNIQAGRSVYVHCKAGRARSALVELCYLMKCHRMNAEQALQTLSEHRKQVTFAADKWATAKEYEGLIISNNS